MATTATPGPWVVNRESEKATGWKGIVVSAGNGAVANIVMQLDDREAANAKLIAAAPDLLEAVQSALDDWDSGGQRYPSIAKLRAARAKAGAP